MVKNGQGLLDPKSKTTKKKPVGGSAGASDTHAAAANSGSVEKRTTTVGSSVNRLADQLQKLPSHEEIEAAPSQEDQQTLARRADEQRDRELATLQGILNTGKAATPHAATAATPAAAAPEDRERSAGDPMQVEGAQKQVKLPAKTPFQADAATRAALNTRWSNMRLTGDDTPPVRTLNAIVEEMPDLLLSSRVVRESSDLFADQAKATHSLGEVTKDHESRLCLLEREVHDYKQDIQQLSHQLGEKVEEVQRLTRANAQLHKELEQVRDKWAYQKQVNTAVTNKLDGVCDVLAEALAENATLQHTPLLRLWLERKTPLPAEGAKLVSLEVASDMEIDSSEQSLPRSEAYSQEDASDRGRGDDRGTRDADRNNGRNTKRSGGRGADREGERAEDGANGVKEQLKQLQGQLAQIADAVAGNSKGAARATQPSPPNSDQQARKRQSGKGDDTGGKKPKVECKYCKWANDKTHIETANKWTCKHFLKWAAANPDEAARLQKLKSQQQKGRPFRKGN